MNLPPGFAERLAEKTDEQLCEMLVKAGVYLPEAIAAARTELHRRGLTPRQMAELEAVVWVKLAQRRRAEKASFKSADRRLHLVWFLIHCLLRG
jgi:hypothetical protein